MAALLVQVFVVVGFMVAMMMEVFVMESLLEVLVVSRLRLKQFCMGM